MCVCALKLCVSSSASKSQSSTSGNLSGSNSTIHSLPSLSPSLAQSLAASLTGGLPSSEQEESAVKLMISTCRIKTLAVAAATKSALPASTSSINLPKNKIDIDHDISKYSFRRQSLRALRMRQMPRQMLMHGAILCI